LVEKLPTEKDYSEEIASQIDKEVSKFTNDAYKSAKKLLTDNRKKLEQIAQVLIKKEVIERKQFERLNEEKKFKE